MQKNIITALTQFYDPALRCFQFQSFQIAPTIEEFSKTIGTPKPISGPFKMIGYNLIVIEMANYFDICTADLKANLRVCGVFKGFPREYLEKKATNFATAMN